MNQKRSPKARWIVTAAWPYVNASPHIGNMLHLVTGDVLSRYYRLKRREVIYVSGSDAHGASIVLSAMKSGIDFNDIVFAHHRECLNLLKRWHIELDNYSTTQSKTHERFCQEFYRNLNAQGHILRLRSRQPFCPRCRVFLSDMLAKGTCPFCGWSEARGDGCTSPECGQQLYSSELLAPRCMICGSPAISRKTTNWYFDLPKFSKEVIKFLQKCPHMTKSIRMLARDIVRNGLRPMPVTVDLEWGIAGHSVFEEAKKKVIYVWAESILGYLSATKEWAETTRRPKEWLRYWRGTNTKTVFCVGRDNAAFHVLNFPALLIATGSAYVLPYAIVATEFIMMDNRPFSKLKGVGIWAEEALRLAPADYWRYFLIIERPETANMNFTWKRFADRVNNDLYNVFGRFVDRTLYLVHRDFERKVPPRGKLTLEDRSLLRFAGVVARKQARFLNAFKLRNSLETVLALARAGNNYLAERMPCLMAKNDKKIAATVLNVSVQLVNALAVLVYPYMPTTAEKIRIMLNLPTRINASEFEKIAKTPIPALHSVPRPKPLFRKLDVEELKKKHEDFAKVRQSK